MYQAKGTKEGVQRALIKDSMKVIIEEGVQNAWTESEHIAGYDSCYSSCAPAKIQIHYTSAKVQCRDIQVFYSEHTWKYLQMLIFKTNNPVCIHE
jgi:hypothetical protein